MNSNNPAWLGGVCAAALMAAASGAQAQDAGGPAPDQVTVYGTANPLPVFDYPGMVSVYDSEQVELLGASTISDLLEAAPGMEFFGGPRRTGEAPALRGLSGQNVLILLDGARQNFNSGHDGRFFIDPALIKTAEVVRGPASALYGSGAVGGVLAFETLDAADMLEDGESFGARVRAGYRDVNEETSLGGTVFGQTGGLDLVGHLSWRNSGDIALGDGTDLTSDDDVLTGMVKAGFSLSEALRAELSWQGFRNEATEPNNGQGLSEDGGTNPLFTTVDKDIRSDTLRAGLDFDPDTNLIDAGLTIYKSDIGVEESELGSNRVIDRQVDSWGVRGINNSTFDLGGAELIATLGFDWYQDEQDGADNTTGDGERPGVPDAESEFTGVFAQLQTTFDLGAAGELLVVPGVRWDQYESDTNLAGGGVNEDDAFSPRLAASYGPSEWLRLFGSYSEGFRAPSVDELYLTGVHFELPHPILGAPVFISNAFIPNPDLLPEKTQTLEFGAGVDFRDIVSAGDRLQVKGSAYQTDAEDLIDLSVDFAFPPTCFAPPFAPCSAGTTNAANVSDATLEGMELEARYDSERFGLYASWSTVDGENNATGDKLGVLTPSRYTIDAQWKFPQQGLLLGARVEAAEDFTKVDDPANARPGYVVLDLYTSWRPDFAPAVRFDAGVDNVLDHNYERVFAGVKAPGRNFRVAASYRFGG